MKAIAGTPVFGIIAVISLARVLFQTWRNEGNENSIALTTAPANVSTETENEKMTPKYLPTPNEAGDGNDKN